MNSLWIPPRNDGSGDVPECRGAQRVEINIVFGFTQVTVFAKNYGLIFFVIIINMAVIE